MPTVVITFGPHSEIGTTRQVDSATARELVATGRGRYVPEPAPTRESPEFVPTETSES